MRLFKPGVLALAVGLVAGVAGSGPAAADETQTVSYRGYQVTVPASWPVPCAPPDKSAAVKDQSPM